MPVNTKNYLNVTVSTDEQNPTHSAGDVLPSTAEDVQVTMTPHNPQTWAAMMGNGILTVSVQRQLANNSWENVVQSTFDAASTGKDGQALFSASLNGLGGATCRLAGWSTTAVTIDAVRTVNF